MSMTHNAPRERGFRFTGWHMVAVISLFFGVMFTANGTLVYFALTTFGGTEVDSSYKAGREIPAKMAEIHAQEARAWTVDLDIKRAPDGHVAASVAPHDKTGAPITGLEVEVRLQRPVDKREDVVIRLIEAEKGRYVGRVEGVEAGNWDAAIVASTGEGVVYRSKNRLFWSAR
jgi:nitrogen fixation protein FixH